MNHERPTHIDLFSGIGGFALAAKWAGFRTVAFCEIEPYCQRVLAKNFGAVADAHECGASKDRGNAGEMRGLQEAQRGSKQRPDLFGRSGVAPRIASDIFTFNGTRYRGCALLTGGFPCQPFSVAGKRRGAADDRHLWPQMLRVIGEARPAWVLGENVPGIIPMELDNVLSQLEAIGYACRPFVIPACAVDARHRRDRLWIVGHATGAGWPATGRDGESFHASDDIANPSEILADPDQPGSQGHGRLPECPGEWASGPRRWPDEGEWFAKSGMGRVALRVPNRIHRLRALGNSIVPQVAFEILRVIRQMI